MACPYLVTSLGKASIEVSSCKSIHVPVVHSHVVKRVNGGYLELYNLPDYNKDPSDSDSNNNSNKVH